MTFSRISVAFCITAPLLCMGSEHAGAAPDDNTWLIQFQTTMDHRSSDNHKVMSENLAAELRPILTTFPNMSKTMDPVQGVCKQLSKWFSPLTSWLYTTMNESHQNIDKVLNESLVIQERFLKGLSNTTTHVNIRLQMMEEAFKHAMLPGGPVETKITAALAPLDLGSLLHLDKYKVVRPDVGKNATFYDLLLKGLFKRLDDDIHKDGLKARTDVTSAIMKFENGLEARVTEQESFWKNMTSNLEHLTSILSTDMAAVMPAHCSSVYEEPLGTANKTIDAIGNNLQIKLHKLATGIHEAAGALKSLTQSENHDLKG